MMKGRKSIYITAYGLTIHLYTSPLLLFLAYFFTPPQSHSVHAPIKALNKYLITVVALRSYRPRRVER